jgi:hypothetical protein
VSSPRALKAWVTFLTRCVVSRRVTRILLSSATTTRSSTPAMATVEPRARTRLSCGVYRDHIAGQGIAVIVLFGALVELRPGAEIVPVEAAGDDADIAGILHDRVVDRQFRRGGKRLGIEHAAGGLALALATALRAQAQISG